MPYRVDVHDAGDGAIEQLIELGALDAERLPGGGVAALMPDSVTPEHLATATRGATFIVSPAVRRDEGSVWVLSQPPIRLGRFGELRLIDAPAFGTGLHPTTALCLEAMQEIIATTSPDAVEQAYRRVGMQPARIESRAGWCALTMRASW